MEENRKEWLQWRKGGIGSSDAPVVMGVSPYRTPYQLWEEKTGKVESADVDNFVTRKGNEYEPIARAKYEVQTGITMPPCRVQHKDYSFIRASMDGFNQEENRGIEIKYVGIDDHNRAKNEGIVPPQYKAQMQHQLIASGAKAIDYCSFSVPSGKDKDGQKIKADPSNGDLFILEVLPDMEWINKYISEAIKFWKLVETDEEPELIDKDFKIIKSSEFKNMSELYLRFDWEVKEAERKLKESREMIEKHIGDKSRIIFESTGLKVIKTYRKGNVDYKKVPELKGVNLEQYRGKTSSSFRFYPPKAE